MRKTEYGDTRTLMRKTEYGDRVVKDLEDEQKRYSDLDVEYEQTRYLDLDSGIQPAMFRQGETFGDCHSRKELEGSLNLSSEYNANQLSGYTANVTAETAMMSLEQTCFPG